MLNHITIMGRLTRDPELRYTQNNIPVASFRVAVDRDFTSRDSGERQTDFIDCVAWRNTGEFVNKYFVKGSMIVVAGRLQIREWTDKENNRRTTAEIVVDNVYFGESRRDRDESAGRSYQSGGSGGGYGSNQGNYGQGGDSSGGYGSNQGNYGQSGGSGGGYNSNQGNYSQGDPGASRAPEPDPLGYGGGGFTELDDDDGELPF